MITFVQGQNIIMVHLLLKLYSGVMCQKNFSKKIVKFCSLLLCVYFEDIIQLKLQSVFVKGPTTTIVLAFCSRRQIINVKKIFPHHRKTERAANFSSFSCCRPSQSYFCCINSRSRLLLSTIEILCTKLKGFPCKKSQVPYFQIECQTAGTIAKSKSL